MRRIDKEIKDTGEIEEILMKAQVARIAMSLNDDPYVIPVNFGFKDNCLYFHSAPEGKKVDILEQNKKICFEVDIDHKIKEHKRPCSWGMDYKSVIGFGETSIINDLKEKGQAMNIIMSHYSSKNDYEFSERALNKISLYKIEINEMTAKGTRETPQ